MLGAGGIGEESKRTKLVGVSLACANDLLVPEEVLAGLRPCAGREGCRQRRVAGDNGKGSKLL